MTFWKERLWLKVPYKCLKCMSTFVFLFQVLDLLWSLSHLPSLTTDMVDQALKSHIEILSDSYAVKEQIKKNYAVKCVEDIRKGVLIVPAIRQLLKITRGMVKQQFNKHDKVGTWLKNKILNTFFWGGRKRSTRTWNDWVHFFGLLHSAFCLQLQPTLEWLCSIPSTQT